MNKREKKFAWWIEILQDEIHEPVYKYYSGLFNSYYEAEWCKSRYIEDLKKENPKIVDIQAEQCQPKQESIYINFFPIYPRKSLDGQKPSKSNISC